MFVTCLQLLCTRNNLTIYLSDLFIYSCFVFVLFTLVLFFNLSILLGVPPDIDEGPFIPHPPTVMPGDMTVIIGTPTYIVDGFDVTLVCNIASGTSPITIMWIRNGASYPAGGNQSIITVPDTDYNDGDVFTCRADNIIGFDMESTTINVFGK